MNTTDSTTHPTAGAGCVPIFAGFGFRGAHPAVSPAPSRHRLCAPGKAGLSWRGTKGFTGFPKRAVKNSGTLHNSQRFEGRDCRVGSSSPTCGDASASPGVPEGCQKQSGPFLFQRRHKGGDASILTVSNIDDSKAARRGAATDEHRRREV